MDRDNKKHGQMGHSEERCYEGESASKHSKHSHKGTAEQGKSEHREHGESRGHHENRGGSSKYGKTSGHNE